MKGRGSLVRNWCLTLVIRMPGLEMQRQWWRHLANLCVKRPIVFNRTS